MLYFVQAQLRASVFLALEEQEQSQVGENIYNPPPPSIKKNPYNIDKHHPFKKKCFMKSTMLTKSFPFFSGQVVYQPFIETVFKYKGRYLIEIYAYFSL